MHRAIAMGARMRTGALPDDLAPEVVLTEDLIEQDLHVVRLARIEVHIERPVLRKQLANEDEALTQELDKISSSEFVSVSALASSTLELLLGCERRIDVAETHAVRAISVFQLAPVLHL